jgi:predicted MPP superfamily phosphohydrolase
MKTNPLPSFFHDQSLHSSPIAKVPSLTGKRTRLAVVSDFHATPDGQGSWKRYHQTVDRLTTTLSLVSKQDVDVILVSGDLTRNDTQEEFDIVATELTKATCKCVCVPGNHDIPKCRVSRHKRAISTFAETFGDGAFPFVHRINDIDIIGLNSMDMRELDSGSQVVSKPQLNQLDNILENAINPIVLLHHPLTGSWESDTALNPEQFQLDNANDVLETLRSHDVPLVVSGHVHWPLLGSAGQLREIISPAVCSYPQAYLLIEVTPEGTTVNMNLLPDTDIQLSAYQNLCEHEPLDGLYAQTAKSDYLATLLSNR